MTMQNDTHADVGLIGLAVMGENLVLNMARNGHRVAVYNRSVEKVKRFVETRAKDKTIIGADSLADLCRLVQRPRRIVLMIRAGAAVDNVVEQLCEYLDAGDIIIDGGNSNYLDTNRRTAALQERDILFVGAGISGGEEGALNGPSIMPGGNVAAWPAITDLLQGIAAKTDDGAPCCAWLGNAGAGHFVKMVHNGIEYCDMQLIAEAYHLMSAGLNMSVSEMSAVFARWNSGPLNSFLIEITAAILAVADDDTGQPLVDVIMDKAGQKGTGRWTAITAIEQGVPAAQIAEAVFARCISSLKTERVAAAGILAGPAPKAADANANDVVTALADAVYASKICAYAQGFHMLSAASSEFGWHLDLGSVASIWRNGCIIRAAFLDHIRDAYSVNPELPNLLVAPHFADVLSSAQAGWRRVLTTAIERGIPAPSMSSALSYYDAYRSERLPANLLQAQRDYFGAHTYERIDRPAGEFHHTNWTGTGGTTASTSYNA